MKKRVTNFFGKVFEDKDLKGNLWLFLSQNKEFLFIIFFFKNKMLDLLRSSIENPGQVLNKETVKCQREVSEKGLFKL